MKKTVPFKSLCKFGKKNVTGGRCSLRGILHVSDNSFNIMERPSHNGNFHSLLTD